MINFVFSSFFLFSLILLFQPRCKYGKRISWTQKNWNIHLVWAFVNQSTLTMDFVDRNDLTFSAHHLIAVHFHAHELLNCGNMNGGWETDREWEGDAGDQRHPCTNSTLLALMETTPPPSPHDPECHAHTRGNFSMVPLDPA